MPPHVRSRTERSTPRNWRAWTKPLRETAQLGAASSEASEAEIEARAATARIRRRSDMQRRALRGRREEEERNTSEREDTAGHERERRHRRLLSRVLDRALPARVTVLRCLIAATVVEGSV